MFQQLLRRLRPRHGTSAWASGGPGGVGRVALFSRRWRVCGHRQRLTRYLLCGERPVVGRSASAYRTALRHLIFTEPALPRAAARFSQTSPLTAKPRRRRAWHSHGRHRVRKHSSRVAIRFFLAVRSLCVAGTWSWCPGHCLGRRSLCVAGTSSWCPGRWQGVLHVNVW
jgi:hypothetical protein